MKILITDGFYSTNIGNAFFAKGLKYVFSQAFPDAVIMTIGDSATNFWNQGGCAYSNDYEYINDLDFDYIVIAGPCLSVNFLKQNERVLNSLKKSNAKLILLSTGGYTYNKEEVAKCKEALVQFKPHALFTRDSVAYEIYKHVVPNTYNGICTAWFLNDYFEPMSLVNSNEYVTFAFDNMPEPCIEINENNILNSILTERPLTSLTHSIPSLAKAVVRVAVDSLNPNASKPELAGYRIIRPTHRSCNRYTFELYNKKNVYVSEVPEGYMNIYKNSSANFTDRVHAAVGSLVWGKPTRLVTKSKRSHLFDRLGVGGVLDELTVINQDRLLEEKNNMISELKLRIS